MDSRNLVEELARNGFSTSPAALDFLQILRVEVDLISESLAVVVLADDQRSASGPRAHIRTIRDSPTGPTLKVASRQVV